MIQTDENNHLSFKLEVFEGPLDLLLKLISKNKVNIYDIPIAMIFEQYMEYIDAMREMNMEIAGEFINMAAELMLIKSRMMLPKSDSEEEEDPRASLTAALIAYQQAKKAAAGFSQLYGQFGGRMVKETDEIDVDKSFVAPHDVQCLIDAFSRIEVRRRIMEQSKNTENEQKLTQIVAKKVTPISEKVVSILRKLKREGTVDFESIILMSRSRSDIIAIFFATLQLAAKRIIKITGQTDDQIPILEINYDRRKQDAGQPAE